MIAKPWRERLIYLAMSLFVAWHTIAIFTAPLPDNALSKALRSVWNPYLNYLRQDSTWSFFAPNIGKQGRIRFIFEDADGVEHLVVPTLDMNPFHPSYRWFRYVYHVVFVENADLFDGAKTIALLCRRYAALRPVFVTVMLYQEEVDLWPEHHLNGSDPLDVEFASTHLLRQEPCPNGSTASASGPP